MLRRLAERVLTVGELAAPLAMSLSAASKHLRVLERAGLVRRTVVGRRHVCRLEPGPLASADEWLRFIIATGTSSSTRSIGSSPMMTRSGDR